MISKKVMAPALAGTGAAGATGTLAWALGLFDGESQEDVLEKAEGVQKAPPASANVGSKRKTKTYAPRRITRLDGAFFNAGSQATESDRKVIEESLTLKIELNKGLHAIIVEAEKDNETDFLWKCELKAISFKDRLDSGQDISEFERQERELKEALKNEDHKKQLVANCSRSLENGEKQKGKNGLIKLETERLNWDKYKFKEKEDYFKRLWTEDFTGIDKLSNDDENIVKNQGNWKIKEKTEGKVTISLGNTGPTCSISGDYEGDLRTKKFKGDKLEEILKLETHNEPELEKKRYLIRNCRKNKEEIKELKIKVDKSNWWFEKESLEKISEGMYENPIEVEPQNASPQ